MSGRHMFLLALCILTVISAASGARKRDVILGGYKPIKDLNDPYVKEVANFAITEYNKEQKEHLQLVKILKGESQVVAGTNYRLTLAANDSQNYQAVVYDKPWTHYRTLTSFTAV